MACSSPKNHTKHHVRSISLPSKLHPTNSKIEHELNKFKSWSTTCTPSPHSVLEGLSHVKEIYVCMEFFLHMQSTQQTLNKYRHEKYVERVLLDGTVEILDVCATLMELVGQIKEHVWDLRSVIRRQRISSLEAGISQFSQFRKKVKKEAKKLITLLKNMGNDEIAVTPPSTFDHGDQYFLATIGVLREAELSTVQVFRLILLSFLTEQSLARRLSMISRMNPRQEEAMDDLESIQESLRRLCKLLLTGKGGETEQLHQRVEKQLGDLELNIVCFEDSLEFIYRRLVKTRASLLNMISS